MTDDESKNVILARRARFIAAALASAGLAAATSCSDGKDHPQVCLSPPRTDAEQNFDAEADADADAPQEESG